MNDLFTRFEQGMLFIGAAGFDLSRLSWQAHPVCAGVWTKTLISRDACQPPFSLVLVRIDPGCSIARHCHSDSLELHAVATGSGLCETPAGALQYTPGTLAVLARNEEHAVHAGPDGLCLVATFVPADSFGAETPGGCTHGAA